MKYLKKSLNGMEPYFSKNLTEGIILNANEAPYLPPKEVLDQFYTELPKTNWNRYPDMQTEELCYSIAKHFNIESKEVVCGVGSDELLETTFKAVLEPKDKVISFSPSFSMYKVFADLCLAEFIDVSLDSCFRFDPDSMIESIKRNQPKIVLICTPNNPTGTFLEKKDVIKIVESTNALVILDMAYIDFADEDYTTLSLNYDNVISFRTFSKAMALPSLRVGYAIAKEDNIRMIQAVKAPYSVTSSSQLLARIAIDNYDLYKDRINCVKVERERVYQALLTAGFEAYPSKSNFIILKMDDALFDILLVNKIYIRKLKGHLYRISIGLKEENDMLLNVMVQYANK